MTHTNHFEPRGLIFDCDGTLADTMPLHWRAWQMITLRHELHGIGERAVAVENQTARFKVGGVCHVVRDE